MGRLCRLLGSLLNFAVWIVLLFLAACAYSHSDNGSFDLRVKQPEDVKALENLEGTLTVSPATLADTHGYQIIKNIVVPWSPEYRVGPGDIVEAVYHIRYERSPEPYRLEVQDKLSVNLPFYPQFSTTAVVRTDGKISLPLVGEIQVESKTPEEVSAYLNAKYARFLKNPSVTVSLEEFNVKIDELKRAITTAPRGQSKIAPVTPDGRISFPMIGTVQAEGLTVVQLEELVNQRYAEQIRNLNVTLILQEIHHPKFYILGEVERPGVYEMTSRINLLSALSMASGHKIKSSDLRELIIFRNDGLRKPIAFKVDLKAMLEHAVDTNIDVHPADIIYVSRSRLTEINDVLEKVFTKGIYTIVPFNTNFTINYDITPVRVAP